MEVARETWLLPEVLVHRPLPTVHCSPDQSARIRCQGWRNRTLWTWGGCDHCLTGYSMESGGQSLPPPHYHREPTLVPQGRSNKSQAGSQGQAPTSVPLPPVASKEARCYLVKGLDRRLTLSGLTIILTSPRMRFPFLTLWSYSENQRQQAGRGPGSSFPLALNKSQEGLGWERDGSGSPLHGI